MRVVFWGVRGSVVTPEQEYAGYGGNTPCIELRLGPDRVVLLDAGLGMRWQSQHMLEQQSRGNVQEILLSHCHWDHIQGIPFSPLMYLPGNRITIRGAGLPRRSLQTNLQEQLRPEFCPVPNFFRPGVGAEIEVVQFSHEPSLRCLDFQVHWAFLPRGRTTNLVVGYRLEHPLGSLAYLTDTEYPDGAAQCPAALELARGVDLLIHDAQFTQGQRAQTRDRGHSTHLEALELARLAGVGRLVCCHHDPAHDDAFLDQVSAELAAIPDIRVELAREGLEIEFTN